MNNNSNEQKVRDRIARLDGKQAQQLFWDILVCIYKDFQTPRMQHDLGNDGYTLNGGVFVACYALEGNASYDNTTTVDKIQEDFDKFNTVWKPKFMGKINTWAFLTKENLMGKPHIKMVELNNLADGCKKENWGVEKMVKLALSLSPDDFARIFNVQAEALIIQNIQNNYVAYELDEESERTIIDEIFDHVIHVLKGYTGNPSRDQIKLEEKIQLNFTNLEEQKAVQTYFNYALTKVKLIEERISVEEVDVQQDLQEHVFGKYYELKTKGLTNMDILHNLIAEFTPVGKDKDPQYTGLARAFVLFHFDDCTIFEKTKREMEK